MPRRRLPTGTVTLVFTDIEGSTRLLRELGTGYTEALRTHRNRIREAFRAHGGTEVDTQGDAFFYAFPRAASAIAAAAAAQDALREGLIRVRIGVHTGEPDTTEEGYVGLDVNQAARICAAAHGGQVVVSDSTARLVDVALRKLGSHRLKDLPTPQWLFQLGEGDFPPLRSLNNTNLPAELTTLIGRERTAEELASLARTSRLVTIVGAGGVGKTRVAIRVANMLLHDFNDGCWFVDLAAITDPASVSAALWSGLGLPNRGSPSQMEEVRRALMDKRCLLVLDNCEHLGSSPATAAAVLVSGCRALHVLATSRQPLGVQGEHVYPLGPLETSAPGLVGASADSPAAELFIARASSQGYEGGDLGARDAIAELCSRLDGIPLAIELAAARARSLPPQELLRRLDDRFRLLARPRQRESTADRQMTLEATIAWSYSLLETEEQSTLQRLSVFRGGFTIPAAIAVCFDIGSELDAVERVGSLVDRSLVQIQDRVAARYRLLESIGLFAEQRLVETGPEGLAVTRGAHASFFSALGDEVEILMRGPEQAFGFARIEAELDNLRACFAWFLENDPSRGLRLMLALDRYWIVVRRAEGRDWLARSLPGVPASSEMRAHALYDAAHWAADAWEFVDARALGTECLRVAREVGSVRYEGLALSALGSAASYEAATGWEGESLPLFEEAEVLLRSTADPREIALILNNYGYTLLSAGDIDGARHKLTEGLATARLTGINSLIASIEGSLADVEMVAGDRAVAEQCWREELRLAQDIGGTVMTEALTGLARLALDDGDLLRCLRLLGAADELFRRTAHVYAPDPDLIRRARATGSARLGKEATDDIWREGTRMPLGDIVSVALGS